MTVEDLKKIRTLERRLRSLSERLIEMQEDAYTVKTIAYDAVMVCGGNGVDIGDKLARLHEQADKVMELYLQLARRKAEIEGVLCKLEDYELQTLLSERYVACKRWEAVAKTLERKSIEYVRINLHQKALSEFEKICKTL